MAGHPYTQDLAHVRQGIADDLGSSPEDIAPTPTVWSPPSGIRFSLLSP
jgi:hypothetical protein